MGQNISKTHSARRITNSALLAAQGKFSIVSLFIGALGLCLAAGLCYILYLMGNTLASPIPEQPEGEEWRWGGILSGIIIAFIVSFVIGVASAGHFMHFYGKVFKDLDNITENVSKQVKSRTTWITLTILLIIVVCFIGFSYVSSGILIWLGTSNPDFNPSNEYWNGYWVLVGTLTILVTISLIINSLQLDSVQKILKRKTKLTY